MYKKIKELCKEKHVSVNALELKKKCSNTLRIFQNKEFGSIRTVVINNEPWFVGKDIAEALGYGNGNKNSKALNNAVADHVDVEDKGVTKMMTSGGTQQMTIVNESGMYALIFGSKRPSAKKFKKWVTSEVLPSIRKTGQYQMPSYQPKATSIGEIVNLINMTRQSMKDQGCDPREIALVVKQICEQFNIQLPDCFIKPKKTTLQDVYDMIDFIYSEPKWVNRKPTYEDFIAYKVSTKMIGDD